MKGKGKPPAARTAKPKPRPRKPPDPPPEDLALPEGAFDRAMKGLLAVTWSAKEWREGRSSKREQKRR